MHLLPLALGRLADIADRLDSIGKFALATVFLKLNADNTFEAVATDTRCLARVTGPCVAPAGDFPLFSELEAAPDDGTTALIPVDVWKRTFAWARKLVGRRTSLPTACRSLAVRMGTRETTLGVSDGEHTWTETATNSLGRYPSYEDIIARTLAGPMGGQFAVDPLLLGQLLTTAAEFCPDRTALRVEIEPRSGNTPIVVRTGQPGGLEFFGLVMPLTPEPELLTSIAADPIPALEQENASLRAERDELAQQVVMLKAARAKLQ
jgi:hypothetical protein